jgi:hypothetical protein
MEANTTPAAPARIVRNRVHPARRATAERLLNQACENILRADRDRRRMLYAYAAELATFGEAVDLDDVGARLLLALHDSGWPSETSGARDRGTPKDTVDAAYLWVRSHPNQVPVHPKIAPLQPGSLEEAA